MKAVEETIQNIEPVSGEVEEKLRDHQDRLTKPRGSLGYLEELAIRYGMIHGTTRLPAVRKQVVCFAGDHGVVEEGVSAYSPEVTAQMVRNIIEGGAAISVLAEQANAELTVVDVGVAKAVGQLPERSQKNVCRGTKNFLKGPALSEKEVRAALRVGLELAREAEEEGRTLLAPGEMGIGNTTSSSAVVAALLHQPVEEVTGRGTGVDDQGLRQKIQIIERGLEKHAERLTDPLDVLSAVGGTEIAAMAGYILGAATRSLPVVVDGFISSTAALVAERLAPDVADYLIFGHRSKERGHETILGYFDREPLLNLNMRLGEGTGAVLAMNLVEAAVLTHTEMATFDTAGVSDKNE